ncbi:MAG: hypothetical protein L3J88_09935 [Gammaproteobacteria bacterium]|nr:hypothetical protein [Gammaproteobacteria bacterium]
MFTTDLRSQITPYTRQQANWGGAACCRMAMNGYPPGAVSCNINQATIWNYIQANNQEPGVGSWGIGWWADPYAITKTLNDLCPPQHSWIDVSGTDKNVVLYTLLRYMANYKYASLVCTFSHDYWKTLVYYKTSDDPRVVNNPTLQRIGFYSPDNGSYSEIDGAIWMVSPSYWGAPCNGQVCGQNRNNKWVGLGEPPEEEGSVEVESISRVGKRLIESKEASKIAQEIVAERRSGKSEFLARRLNGMCAGTPILVRELPLCKPKKRAQEVRYYVVPFGNKYELDESDSSSVRLSVLVNAYTGRFEEMTLFSQPVHYLSGQEALRIAARNLGYKPREMPGVELELVAQPSQSVVSAAVPAWSVTVAGRTIHVAQSGQIIGNLALPTYKGG